MVEILKRNDKLPFEMVKLDDKLPYEIVKEVIYDTVQPDIIIHNDKELD